MDDRTSAIDHLRTIRALMERANVYRAVNVPTALFGGGLSATTAYGLHALDRRGTYLDATAIVAVWMAVAILVGLFNTILIWRTARRSGDPFWSPTLKMALKALAPALFVGGVLGLTLALGPYGDVAQASACCAMFYGLALMATSGFSPRSLRVLGLASTLTGLAAWAIFMTQANLAYLTPERWSAIIMGSAFGLFHLVYGVIVGLLQRRSPRE